MNRERYLIMSNSLSRLNQALQKLEDVIASRSVQPEAGLQEENTRLKNELAASQQECKTLKTTSQEVINELNNAVHVIEDYFKKQNANS